MRKQVAPTAYAVFVPALAVLLVAAFAYRSSSTLRGAPSDFSTRF